MLPTSRIAGMAGLWMTILWGAAHAAPQSFVADLDRTPGFESTFTFDFGGGFFETAAISDTEFTLEIDADASPAGSARFLAYQQRIESINLPDPTGGATPIPTGELTVEVLSGTSGVGSYDANSGSFSTSETYRIHYAGDLSAYGLTGGFVDLPSQSTGRIRNEGGVWRIVQDWAGSYTFPGTNVSVAYTCQVNTQAVPEPGYLTLWYVLGLAGMALRRR
jgi:hypothetical protein